MVSTTHDFVRQLALLDAEGALGMPDAGRDDSDTHGVEEIEADSSQEVDVNGEGGLEGDAEEGAGQAQGPVFAVSGAKLLYLGHYGGSLYLNERVRPGTALPEQWSEFKALAPLVKLHWHPYISTCAPNSFSV